MKEQFGVDVAGWLLDDYFETSSIYSNMSIAMCSQTAYFALVNLNGKLNQLSVLRF